jgi:uncharacterized protein (DUF4415 family)
MSEEIIVRYSPDNLPKDTETDWVRLDAMTEEEIEANALSDPDNPPMDMSDFWERGVAVDGARNLTRLNLDPDILYWFQKRGQGYTSVINEFLQAYMETNEHIEPPSRKPTKEAQ